MDKFPKISFIIPTYNATKHLQRCLTSIRNQDYPADNIEILVLDGGSQDDILTIAKDYNCFILENKRRLAEYGVQLGMLNAQGDLVVVFAADNELCGRDWINKIKTPFLADEALAACWCRLKASEDDRPLNKYFSLIQSDPLSFFMNKNIAFYLKYAVENKIDSFYVFDVDKNKPLVWGANGLTYRKRFIQDVWRQEGYLGDNDAFQIMITLGKNRVAYSQDVFVYHHHVASLQDWIKKWRRNYKLHFLDKLNTRNLDWVFIPRFNLRLAIWLVYSLCPLFSGVHSIYLCLKDKNIYWLYHPLVSFLQTLTYAYITIITKEGRNLFKNLIIKNINSKKENLCIS
jgi:glycosyltransferase involved in cell wall biosynthesis